MSGVILPQIRRVSMNGFEPLFTDGQLTMELPQGPFLLLGGNGLGKTTSLQTIVFAIAGEVDPQIEERTDFQWGSAYFRSRLNQASEAEIEVEYSLDNTILVVRRRMSAKAVRGVRIDDGDWIHDSIVAAEKYEAAVCRAGGYEKFEDFRYLVHRLCYLAENRRSLLWDQAAQLRVVMMICGDMVTESEFRTLKSKLKETDSEMRHAHVDMSKLQARLDQLAPAQSKEEAQSKTEDSRYTVVKAVEQTSRLESELKSIAKKRHEVRQQLLTLRRELAAVNESLEKLQTKYGEIEDAFVLDTLRGMESSSTALALHKLLVHELCPYCTQSSSKLANQAREWLANGLCPICGQRHATTVSPNEFRSLRLELIEKTAKQDELQRTVDSAENNECQLVSQELSIQNRLNVIVAKLPRVQFVETSGLVGSSAEALQERLQITQAHHARLEAKKQLIQEELMEKYDAFARLCSRRLKQLAALAGEYGVEFLGSSCEFVLTPSRERLSPFSFYVPVFAERKRETVESCSESERFFLDIAFRMAVLAFAGILSKTRSTFVCETPENALDLAYTDNVAAMFKKFSVEGFSVVLTANLQLGGVAKPLLADYPKKERKERVINLIEKCHLTNVQIKRKKEFLTVYKSIVG